MIGQIRREDQHATMTFELLTVPLKPHAGFRGHMPANEMEIDQRWEGRSIPGRCPLRQPRHR
eukprot:scaffold305236_cov17-Prasinocladus_malaysianus.AAC.1